MGLNGDCYQEAEETYALMPALVGALSEAGVAFTVYTRSALVLRDAALLAASGAQVAVSIAFVDERVRRAVEPGAPSAQRRLELVAELVERGVTCRVLMAPVLPLLTDSAEQLTATVRRIAAAGASAVEPVVLRLPPGTRSWFLSWLEQAHPALPERYGELYDRAGLPEAVYESRVLTRVADLAGVLGITCI